MQAPRREVYVPTWPLALLTHADMLPSGPRKWAVGPGGAHGSGWAGS
jgi:hypothetical protein